MDIELKGRIIYGTTQPYKVELTRGQKGIYAWTITYHGELRDEVLNNLSYIDLALRRDYLPPVAPLEES